MPQKCRFPFRGDVLYTSQLRQQREEDEKTPLMTRYVPFMEKWRTD